jgi:RNA recognition motif-containing protein
MYCGDSDASMGSLSTDDSERATRMRPVISEKARDGAAAMISPLPTMEAEHNSYCRNQQPLHNAKSRQGKARRTILLAYLPRSATEQDVQHALAKAGISGCVSVNIMREGGESKCFGFVCLHTPTAAKATLEACNKGSIVIGDNSGKAWHIKASWARSEMKDRTIPSRNQRDLEF